MNTQDIQDVLALQRLLASQADTGQAGVIAELIEWRNSSKSPTQGAGTKLDGTPTTRKRGKTERFEPTPDPSESSDSDEPNF